MKRKFLREMAIEAQNDGNELPDRELAAIRSNRRWVKDNRGYACRDQLCAGEIITHLVRQAFGAVIRQAEDRAFGSLVTVEVGR